MEIDISLSKRELDVMRLLWKSKKPYTASEIAKYSNISISTVHTVVNKLLEKNMIVVDEIVYSGKVLSRCYKPTISSKSYDMRKAIHAFKGIISVDFSTSNFIAALLGQESGKEITLHELNELEKMIKEKKEELMQERQKEGDGENK